MLFFGIVHLFLVAQQLVCCIKLFSNRLSAVEKRIFQNNVFATHCFVLVMLNILQGKQYMFVGNISKKLGTVMPSIEGMYWWIKYTAKSTRVRWNSNRLFNLQLCQQIFSLPMRRYHLDIITGNEKLVNLLFYRRESAVDICKIGYTSKATCIQ